MAVKQTAFVLYLHKAFRPKHKAKAHKLQDTTTAKKRSIMLFVFAETQ